MSLWVRWNFRDQRRRRSITDASDHREHIGWRQVDCEVDEDSGAHNWNGLGLVTVEVDGMRWHMSLEVDGDI